MKMPCIIVCLAENIITIYLKIDKYYYAFSNEKERVPSYFGQITGNFFEFAQHSSLNHIKITHKQYDWIKFYGTK